MIRRLLAALLTAALALMLATTAALAGGWAEVKPDASTTTEPTDGESIILGFTVLQHGETPASWVTPTVHLVDLTTGRTHEIAATATGAEGHFAATTPALTAGHWAWSVSFPELASDGLLSIVAVHAADGAVPAFGPARGLEAIAATPGATIDGVDPATARIDRLEADARLRDAVNDRLTARVAELTAERDALATAVASESMAVPPTLLAGVLLLAILAGGLTAFAIVGLAGRTAPREVPVSPEPTPRGSSPA